MSIKDEETQVVCLEQCNINFPKSKIVLADIQNSIPHHVERSKSLREEDHNSNRASTQASKNLNQDNENQNLQSNTNQTQNQNANQNIIIPQPQVQAQNHIQNQENNIQMNQQVNSPQQESNQQNNEIQQQQQQQQEKQQQQEQQQESQNQQQIQSEPQGLVLLGFDKNQGDATKNVKFNADVQIHLINPDQKNKKNSGIGGTYKWKNPNLFSDSINSGVNSVSDSNNPHFNNGVYRSALSTQPPKQADKKKNKKGCECGCSIF